MYLLKFKEKICVIVQRNAPSRKVKGRLRQLLRKSAAFAEKQNCLNFIHFCLNFDTPGI